MEDKTDGLVLRTADYGENDKMLTLLTAARGKISACARGVKKAGAKLSFAAQPFCFAEYVFAVKGGRNTLTAASLYDGFYSLREDVEKFYAGAVVLEACEKLACEGEESSELLVSAVRALGEIAEGDAERALVKFLLSALDGAGYCVRAAECPVCGEMPAGRMRFDFAAGAFTCYGCSDGAPASETTYRAVREAQGKDAGEGGGFGGEGSGADIGDGRRRALRLLKAYFSDKTECDLAALDTFLELGA